MTTRAQYDIPLVLPGLPDVADACVERLVALLKPRAGVTEVHVLPAVDAAPAKLCIHYDHDALSLATIRSEVHAAGAEIAQQFGHLLWQVDGVVHARRARTIEGRVGRLPGVLEAVVNPAGAVRVEFERAKITESQIEKALAEMGVAPSEQAAAPTQEVRELPAEAPPHECAKPAEAEREHEHEGPLGANSELIFVLACGVFLATGFAIEKLWQSVPAWLALGCYVGAYGFGGFFTVREAIDNLRLKRFEIDTLMLVAAAGAAALGAWAEGALLLLLFSLGHALEHFAMGRAKRAIEALADLAPRTALVRRLDGSTVEVGVEDLAVGEIVIVKPDQRIAADGFVIKGASAVNQAPVTGESIPVDKRAVDDPAQARANPDRLDAASRVFAGTINGSGAIEVEVTRLASDSTLAKVVRMVSEAETQKSPTQRFTDRFERMFVPAVLGLAVLLLFAWVVIDEPFRDSFYRAMAVLVAASPCALAIATPSAVLSGVARAARGGVLIKGGAPLELLGSLDAIAFDKTGTLTSGEPRIRQIIPASGVTKEELMAIAVAVESLSGHPLAQAIARDGKAHVGTFADLPATDLKSLTGRGVSARVEGELILIGKAEMFGADGVEPLSQPMTDAIEQLRQTGHTTMVVRRGDQDLGAIGLMDTPREAARATIERLHAIGIRRMIMISGDKKRPMLCDYLPLYFPEIERFAGNSRSDWFLALIERFPTPASMTATLFDSFVGARRQGRVLI